jgi:hypothetical protein
MRKQSWAVPRNGIDLRVKADLSQKIRNLMNEVHPKNRSAWVCKPVETYARHISILLGLFPTTLLQTLCFRLFLGKSCLCFR